MIGLAIALGAADGLLVALSQEQQKHESTLIAQLALRGHATHKLERGGYLVVWQGCSRHCGDLESLEAFARQVGAVG